jgi:transposase
VHAVDRTGRMLLAKAMLPDRFFAWCAGLPAGCLVAMPACGGAHHVARRLGLLGLGARLVAGRFVTPCRMAGKSGKNDANDAAAICEAAGRSHMRFVPLKTAEQQSQLAVHRLREGFTEERAAQLSGQMSNKFNWLATSGRSIWEASACKAHETSVFSTTESGKICRQV